MTPLSEKYIEYITSVRRYSERTRAIYSEVIECFENFAMGGQDGNDITRHTDADTVRRYEAFLLEKKNLSPRTVNLHLSVMSGFCRFLVKRGDLQSNPVKSVPRPKTGKKLPEFYRHDAMKRYFSRTMIFADRHICSDPAEFIEKYILFMSRPGYRKENDGTLLLMEKLSEHPEKFSSWLFEKRLKRAIVSTLYSTGIRRAELIGLKVRDVDFGRNTIRVTGKGDKTREIPMTASLYEEISLYLHAVETMVCGKPKPDSPLFVTPGGKGIYPVYVDRTVKSELGDSSIITARKSPHVLRHTLATELLDAGADLNSIKELLGHSSLAATQVYTHNTIAKLKKIYETAHPRAKSGGKHGD